MGRMFQTTFLAWLFQVAEAKQDSLTRDERDELEIKAWGKYAAERLEENPDFFFTDGHIDMGDCS